jgi:hypothetical protein
MNKKFFIFPGIMLLIAILTIGILYGTDRVDASSWDHSLAWNGVNGADNNIDGYGMLWVLGGSGATAAELRVTFSDGSNQVIAGDKQGNGAFHFTSVGVPGAHAIAAIVYYNGAEVNAPLTISHTVGTEVTTTTTTEEETTTTTTEKETTTTTEPETTTTTTEEETTTTTDPETTTTTWEAELG